MDPLAELDATAQADLVRRGDLKPVELIDAAIVRIEKTDPELGAVITPLFGKARASALAIDPARAPYPGVPILLTDLGAHSAGDPFHAGMKVLRELGWCEETDSAIVRRLRAAGFAIAGKANVSELGLLPTSEPEAFGPTRNPFDPTRSAGGSSGGAAAAVAAGLVPVAHGTDGAGAIRIPASHCGLVGLKPTRGRVSLGPGTGERWGGLSVEHVLARSLRDSAALLDVLAGAEPGDPYTAPPPRRRFAAELGAQPGRLRVALRSRGTHDTTVSPDCVAAVSRAACELAAFGHHVEETSPEALDDPGAMGPLATVILSATAHALDAWSAKVGRPLEEGDVEPMTWAVTQVARRHTVSQYLAALEYLHAYGRRLAAFFAGPGGFDLLLSPTTVEPAPMLGSFAPEADNPFAGFVRAAAFTSFTSPWSISGQPAVSLPLHATAEGLPVGVQLVAAAGREDLLLRVAAQLDAARPRPRPRVHASAPPASVTPARRAPRGGT